MRLLYLARPFGVALAVFIFMNLALALKRPSLSASRVWLYLRIPEPQLSVIASALGMGLLLPHAWASRAPVRLLLAGVLLGFLALSGSNVLGFYEAMRRGRMATGLPVPFSALIVLILAAEAARVIWWAPRAGGPMEAGRRILFGGSVAAAFALLILAHIVTFGLTDYSTEAGADAVVVPGARVYPDGRLSHALEDRMYTAVQLYRKGRARRLILTGGVTAEGGSEPRAMARYAIEAGVPPDAVIIDEEGWTTYDSARNCGRIARAHGLRKLLVVSQYFHNARVKLIFEREGTPCLTVPARYRRLEREGYYLLRETIAFPYYHLRHTGKALPPSYPRA